MTTFALFNKMSKMSKEDFEIFSQINVINQQKISFAFNLYTLKRWI